jgi:N,N-dimethylformamidase
MLRLTAYADRISVAPGEQISFTVNCELDTYDVDFVRIRSGDTNPAGPGIREEVVDSAVSGQKPGRPQQILAGSYGYVPHASIFDRLESFTVQAMVLPTTPDKGEQSIIAKWSAETASGFRLIVDGNGAAGLVIGDGRGTTRSAGTGKPMLAGEWYFVAAAFDREAKQVAVYQEPLVQYATVEDAGVTQATVDVEAPGANPSPLVFAGHHDASVDGKLRVGGLYNGKIDSPRLANRALTRTEMRTLQ